MQINEKNILILKNKLSQEGIRIINKKDSKFMKLLSFLIFFNKNFMTSFTTTIGNIIYVSTEFEQRENISKVITLLHEFVHFQQKNNDKLFQVKYLFPQILILFSLFLFPFIGLISLLFLLFLLPIPAYFRMKAEVEAYGINLFLFEKSGSFHMEHEFENCVKQFISPNYFFMWPFEDNIRKRLLKSWHNISDGNPTEKQRKSLKLLIDSL